MVSVDSMVSPLSAAGLITVDVRFYAGNRKWLQAMQNSTASAKNNLMKLAADTANGSAKKRTPAVMKDGRA